MKFESGYNVETVFDGSKLGIEPFSVGVMPSGDLLVLDSLNSNIYRVSLPLSKCGCFVSIHLVMPIICFIAGMNHFLYEEFVIT